MPPARVSQSPTEALFSSRSVAVLSPHPDDAVLSLGGTIAALSRRGIRVRVITVLAGDPDSTEPAGAWDARAGFKSAGEAARARREEDRRACLRLGAEPVWLSFPDDQYREPDDQAGPAVATAVGSPDAVLVPGYPLTHPDHQWLSALVAAGPALAEHELAYLEHPYTLWVGGLTPPLTALFADPRPALRDRLSRARATAAYRSQLPLLGLGGPAGPLRRELRGTSEGVAWRSSVWTELAAAEPVLDGTTR